jgi:CrcB protein
VLGGAAAAALLVLAARGLYQKFATVTITVSAALAANAGTLRLYLWIAIGSACGGMARYWCSGVAARLFGETFPWGTLIINIIGSLVIGFFAALTGPDGRVLVGPTARQFVMVGICGGYTTFSSFSLQTLNLVNDGEWFQAAGNVSLSVVLCLIAVWTGHAFAVGLNGGRWA